MRIAYFIPGQILFIRYYRNSIAGLILTELLPFFVCALLSKVAIISVFVACLALYSFYEIGYVWNDTISTKREKCPKYRDEFSQYNIKQLVIIRLTQSVLLIHLTTRLNGTSLTNAYAFAMVICVVFLVHNTFSNVAARLGSFLLLNITKIYFVFLVSNLDARLLIGFAPHLAIKYTNYLAAKNLVAATRQVLDSMSLPIFVGLSVVPLIACRESLFVYAVFASLHLRSEIKKAIPSRALELARVCRARLRNYFKL